MAFETLDPGDETRKNGDYLSLPHGAAEDGTGGPAEGDLVGLDADGNITAVDNAGGTEVDVIGVLYTYQYGTVGSNEEPQRTRQVILTDREATVLTHGAVKANVGGYDAAGTGYGRGDVLGANGELVVMSEVDADGYAEVLLR